MSLEYRRSKRPPFLIYVSPAVERDIQEHGVIAQMAETISLHTSHKIGRALMARQLMPEEEVQLRRLTEFKLSAVTGAFLDGRLTHDGAQDAMNEMGYEEAETAYDEVVNSHFTRISS
jgi:hypothetical protein